ncbi:MAG: hypothetical protein M1165_00825 [Candidatus Pacearchaeota archaeon]|nr:hypothetical protein [Candidatus Pacearchaeota archaeon]MDE1848476.1 hypothetical protein [Nanoarchaeota archaeon]
MRFNNEIKLLEELAKLEHQQWAHWTTYLLNNLTKENIKKWTKQIKTPYPKLSEKEKESDREWGKKVLEIIKQKNNLGL